MTPIRTNRRWSAALTLSERATVARTATVRHTGVAATPENSAAARQRRWRAQRPFDQPHVFAKRLAQDQLTESQFDDLVATRPSDLAPPQEPPWVEHMDRVDGAARELAQLSRPREELDRSGLGPVRAFVEPFATAAMARLYEEAQHVREQYINAPFDARRATELFEPALWNQLFARAMKTIVLELNVARVQGTLVGDSPEARCTNFAEQLRAGPVRDQIIDEYPVLARSLVTACSSWAAVAAEFLAHLAADAPTLAREFAASGTLGQLTAVNAGAGDPHRHGRSVIVAEFSSGTRIVYKPRSLSVDAHFRELVDWINARGQTPPLRAVPTLTIGDHGWAEFIPNTPCATHEEVALFYERFGGFLAVLHALNATDFHYENVIACGEYPMLIDLEALFHPLNELSGDDNPELIGWGALQESVLRTGVLPFRSFDGETTSGLDLSAMGGSGGQQTPNRFPVLVAAGTDEMHFERDFVRLPDSYNRPSLGGGAVDPAAFADRVLEGFSHTYRVLLTHRDELLGPRGPIDRFRDDDIRIVLRPTRQYALLLSEAHHPDVMRDALERDRLMDRLWIAVAARPELEQIIKWEHVDLLEGDVPLFTSRPGSRDLFTTHHTSIVGFFGRSGLRVATDRIKSLSEDDLQRQRWIVEASLVALLPARHSVSPAHQPPAATTGAHVSPDEVVDAARRIGHRLLQVALRRGNHVSWLGVTLVRERDWVVQPVGTDLYSGSLGIALFLAYLDRAVDHNESREIAETIARQTESLLNETLSQASSDAPQLGGSLGAFGALGGAVYAFAHLGALWNDRSLINAAERVVSAMSPHIERDQNLDIIAGAAGFLLAAASLERARPSSVTRVVIRDCANVLLARAQRLGTGLAWPTAMPATHPLTGLSHGASGIALALATAASLLNESSLLDACTAALSYERSVLDPAAGNWPDFRLLDGRGPTDPPPTMWAWCHGAPGIGLVRLVALGLTQSPELLTDLATALSSTARYGFGANDSLCHGDLGNLELLGRARASGYSGGWEATLDAETARLVPRLRRGEWRCGIPGGVETPGLMTGLAGIGYGLLRLAAPEIVPSVLSLEPPVIARAPGSNS